MRTEYRHDLQKRSLLLVIFLLTFVTAFLLKNSEKRETSAAVKDSSTLVIDAGHGGIDCGALAFSRTLYFPPCLTICGSSSCISAESGTTTP